MFFTSGLPASSSGRSHVTRPCSNGSALSVWRVGIAFRIVNMACFKAQDRLSSFWSYHSRNAIIWPVLFAVNAIPPGKRWSCHHLRSPAHAKKSILKRNPQNCPSLGRFRYKKSLVMVFFWRVPRRSGSHCASSRMRSAKARKCRSGAASANRDEVTTIIKLCAARPGSNAARCFQSRRSSAIFSAIFFIIPFSDRMFRQKTEVEFVLDFLRLAQTGKAANGAARSAAASAISSSVAAGLCNNALACNRSSLNGCEIRHASPDNRSNNSATLVIWFCFHAR